MFDVCPSASKMTKNDRYGLLQPPWTRHPAGHLHSTTMLPLESPAQPGTSTGTAASTHTGPPSRIAPAAVSTAAPETLGQPTRTPDPDVDPVQHLNGAHSFDEREFRDAMGAFASGVTIITTHGADGPVGFTCQSFTSVSIDPPLVSFSIARTSRSLVSVRDHGRVVINFLSREQQHLSGQFARSGTDKWQGVSWYPSRSNGAPTLDGATGWVAGEIEREADAGDHLILLVRVTGISTDPDRAPLLFYRGAYRELEYMI